MKALERSRRVVAKNTRMKWRVDMACSRATRSETREMLGSTRERVWCRNKEFLERSLQKLATNEKIVELQINLSRFPRPPHPKGFDVFDGSTPDKVGPVVWQEQGHDVRLRGAFERHFQRETLP